MSAIQNKIIELQHELSMRIEEIVTKEKEDVRALENKISKVQEESSNLRKSLFSLLTKDPNELIVDYYSIRIKNLQEKNIRKKWENKLLKQGPLLSRWFSILENKSEPTWEFEVTETIIEDLFVYDGICCEKEEAEIICKILGASPEYHPEWLDNCVPDPEFGEKSQFLEILEMFDQLIELDFNVLYF